MEAAAGAAAARGVSLPISASSEPSRKEWRAVSEQSLRNSTNEELERMKLGHCDERLIYEVQQRIEPADMDFCSVQVDEMLDNDMLLQRLQVVAKQRVELQHMEIALQAQVIARSEVMQMQNTIDAQIKEHASFNVKLQEQLHEKEQKIHELERKMKEREQELHAIRLDNEAAWAKEDLLMEQSKELQSYRRESDNSEAEKAQHIKQIHDLQEHIQDKEQQFIELQEQNRIAQETILVKDEQFRDAQSWMTRAQEMDALQSATNHTLQAELCERTEQCSQLWFGCQRQFGEMERLHLHIQQLQLELTDAREKRGSHSDGSRVSLTSSKDAHVGQSNENQPEVNGNVTPLENTGSPQDGNAESASFPSGGNSLMQTENVQGVPFAPSLFGLPTYLPTGQVTALHPLVMHQGLPHSVPSHLTQSHFQSVPAMSSLQHWQNHLALSDGQHVPSQDQDPLQTEQNLSRIDANYDYQASLKGEVIHANYLDASSNRRVEPNSPVPSPNKDGQQSLQQIASQFHEALRLDSLENIEAKEENVSPVAEREIENISLTMEQPTIDVSSTGAPTHPVTSSETMMNAASDSILSDAFVSTELKSTHAVGKSTQSSLLDERALLACIVRTIGSSGRIRISSTLPNRLGKMLAPLHWHDYKKKYGKLEDFVASHPELFVIGGDYIQLREGAQEIIATTAAVAKVTAAAAAASSTYLSLTPSVAVTPMAHPNRLKKASSVESTSVNAGKTIFNEFGASRPASIANKPSHYSEDQNLNGVSVDVGGVSKVKILNGPKYYRELNGSETRPARTVLLASGNGTKSDRNDFSQIKVTSSRASLVWKQGRTTVASSYRR